MILVPLHELKCWPAQFDAILRHAKTYELRKNDRDFRDGDELLLREWKPRSQKREDGVYTGRQMRARIGYVTRVDDWAAMDEYEPWEKWVVFSLLDVRPIGDLDSWRRAAGEADAHRG